MKYGFATGSNMWIQLCLWISLHEKHVVGLQSHANLFYPAAVSCDLSDQYFRCEYSTLSIFQMSISNELITFIFYISFCMVFLFEMFLACYFGNEIILSNAILSHAIYSSNWINLSPKFKKDMFMFLEALKRPTMLKTGKLFKLSLESFLIVRHFVAFSWYNLLLNNFRRSSIDRTVCLLFYKIQ